MKKMTTKQKAHTAKEANAGHSKNAQRKLHMKEVKIAMRKKEIAMRKELIKSGLANGTLTL